MITFAYNAKKYMRTPKQFNNITERVIDDLRQEIVKLHPVYFVMRDASAANDNVIDNFEQLLETYSKDTVRKIL